MWKMPRAAMTAVLCALPWFAAQAQKATPDAPKPIRQRTDRRKKTLTAEDRNSLLAAAFDWKKSRAAGRDCSHLVHAIYVQAGFPYQYADSEDLYSGVHGFQRVSRPEPGDVVVWHGHAGIVIHPSHHTFFSFLSSGPAIDDYRSHYWKGRGQARFYRYIKNDPCAGCTLARSGE